MAAGDTLVTLFPAGNEPPAANFATLDTRNSHPLLNFDPTTQEAAIFTAVLPRNYAGSGLTVSVTWCAATATSGTIGWDVAIEAFGDGATDIDSDSFASAATITAATVPGTSGSTMTTSVDIANGGPMDNLAVGQAFRIRIRRDVAADTAAGDAQLLAVELEET